MLLAGSVRVVWASGENGASGGAKAAVAAVSSGEEPLWSQLTGISIHTAAEGGKTTIEVSTSRPTEYRVLHLDNPARLVLDLEDAQNRTNRRSYSSHDSPFLERVRVGKFSTQYGGIVRVVVDLRGDPAYSVDRQATGFRIELTSKDGGTKEKSPNAVHARVPSKKPAVAAVPKAVPKVAENTSKVPVRKAENETAASTPGSVAVAHAPPAPFSGENATVPQSPPKTVTSTVVRQGQKTGSPLAGREVRRSLQSNLPGSPSSAAEVISGVVLDPSGALIVGAQVMMQTRGTTKKRFTTTDRKGEFHFDGVIPGDYEITVQSEGFQLWRRSLTVEVRSPKPMRIEMQLARLNEKLTVSGSNGQLSTSASENADVINLDQQSLNFLPILGNDVVGAVKTLMGPGAQVPGAVQIDVDGVPLSDIKMPVSAIKEVKINKDPYSALYSSPGQKRIEITTKTGSKEYHGSLDAQYRGHQLNARNAFATEQPPEQRVYYGGALSGPLGKTKKTTFMVNGERDNNDMQAIVYAQTPSGTVSQNFPTPFTATYFTGVVDRQLNENNQLSLRYSYYGESYDGSNVGGLNLPETAENSSSQNHYLFLTDRAVLTNSLVNELSLRLMSMDNSTQSVLPGHPSIVVLGAFTGGGAQQTMRETRNYLQLADILSWSHGKHLVKAGVSVPAFTRRGLDDQSNFGGTFQFSSLQDYEQGTPFSFVQNQGNGRLVFWQKELGFFAQDEIRLRDNLSVSFGLRYDWQNYVSNLVNFAPRFSFAYAPGKSRKTVLRGGAGVFYQMTGGGAIMDMLRYDGNTLLQYVVSNPGYPNPFGLGGAAQALPSSIVRFAPHLRLPYVIQYSLGLERRLTRSTTFTAIYTGMQGFDQFLSQDVNAPLPPNYVDRPNPAIATLRQIGSSGRMEARSLKLSLNSSIGHTFSGGAQYQLGRSMDNTDGIDWFPANQYNMAGEWGRSSFDVRNSFRIYGTVNMPKLLRFGTIMSIESGRPYTETTGTDVYGTTFSNARPLGVARNTLAGPGGISLDVRLAREFALRSHKANGAGEPSLTLRLDAFNAINHTNLHTPVGELTSPFFGQSISAGPPRRLQLSLGLQF